MTFRRVNLCKVNSYRLILLAMALALFGSLVGCINGSSLQEGAIDFAAVSIPSEYGRVEEVWAPAGPIDRAVVIFGERHDLIKARENIARMLEYLHQKFQISFIGLEATPTGALDTSGFKALPEFENLEQLKKEMVWTLLDDGEINPYEYMGITYGIDVYGVENWDLYRRNLRASESIDWDALTEERIQLVDWVFSKLLERLVSKLEEEDRRGDLEKLNKCLERLLQERAITFEEFLECAAELDRDGFVEFKAIWDQLIARESSAGEELHNYLKGKSIEYGKGFPPEDMPNIGKYDTYLQLAEERGYAMAGNLASLMKKPGVKIAALGMGAAHTEVLKELRRKRIPYIYVIPRGMAATATEWEEKAREQRLDEEPLSHDIGGLIDEWLPKDLMGQPRVDKKWFRLKVEALYTSLIATRLKQMTLANEEIEETINNAFSQYERAFVPFWDEMQKISGDFYLPFEIAGKRAVIRITHDEIAYNVRHEHPVLAHGRITSGDFYQIIEYIFWQNEANRQQFIEQVLQQRAPKPLLDQFRLVYSSIKEGKSPEKALEEVEAFDSILSTGKDVYGFYRDLETDERHFIRLTEEPFTAWAEPSSHIVRHGPVAETLRYEEINLEPFLEGLSQDVKETVLNDQVLLAKLDSRLRSSGPTLLLSTVEVKGQKIHLLARGEGEGIKVMRVEDDISELLKKVWEEKMGKDPTFPAADLIKELTDEEKELIRDKLVLPLVSHLKVDKERSEKDKVMLDLKDEYKDFVILDLSDDPVVRTIVSHYLRDNRVVYVAESSTARDIEEALQVTIDHRKLKLFIALPPYAFYPEWAEKVAALQEKIDRQGLGIKLTDLTDLAKKDPEEAKRLLRNALGEEDSLVLAFGHIRHSKNLDLGGGEKSEFTQGEVPEFITPIPRFVAFVGCKSYATGWSDTIISKKVGKVSFGFWEEFNADTLFEFLNKLVDELGKEPDVRPLAIPFFLNIAEELGIPGRPIVKLPMRRVEG